jgi:DNA-binding response OmpR family regulator
VLLVEPGHVPPTVTDVFEDWVRQPITHLDLDSRVQMLASRRQEHDQPKLEGQTQLVFRGERGTISPSQSSLAELLSANFEQLVLRAALTASLGHPTCEVDAQRNILNLHIGRLRRRILPLGLDIRTVWGCGYVLESTDALGVPPRQSMPMAAVGDGGAFS